MRNSILSLCFVSVFWAATGLSPADGPLESSGPAIALFDGNSLADGWSFDDPDGDDAISVTARPGWLQIQAGGPDEDIWSDGRGGAPLLRRKSDPMSGSFSVETLVDLATSNGGYPVLNSIGGLIVCRPGPIDEEAPFVLTFGLQHNWAGGTEVIVQRPGHSIKWAGIGANAAILRLDHNVDGRTFRGYYKVHADDPWTLLAEIAEDDPAGGPVADKLEIGLFAKTWDADVGEPANVDFAYVGRPRKPASAPSTPKPAELTDVSRLADLTSLETFGVSGKERTVLNGYREAEIMRHAGRGCLTHAWFGGDWPGYERTRIRVYVDGEREPSIDMLLGLGHGNGFGDPTAPWGSAKLGKTGHPSGLYNTYKIPFGTGVRITAQRDKDSPDGAPFWWIVRGTENLPISIAGVRLPDAARLKLHKLENHVAKPFEEFAYCDVQGAGALYQVTMAADGLRDSGDWKDISYLEAIVRAYVNGANRPMELSSGLEDYFLGTYYFNRGRYANGLAGLTHIDLSKNTFSAYRFHDDDPLFFRTGLRLTCRCGEEIGGRGLHDPPETRFTTYTWVYQW